MKVETLNAPFGWVDLDVDGAVLSISRYLR